LEDAMLSNISAADADFLGDTALVDSLEVTKHTASEIEVKSAQAVETAKSIDKIRELYRPVAARASLLFFLLDDLYKIHPMYQVAFL
jgi:dynein heavy chain, axonemal